MVVFDFKLTPCEHTRLKDDGHRLALYETVFKVQRLRYGRVREVIEVRLSVNRDDL